MPNFQPPSSLELTATTYLTLTTNLINCNGIHSIHIFKHHIMNCSLTTVAFHHLTYFLSQHLWVLCINIGKTSKQLLSY